MNSEIKILKLLLSRKEEKFTIKKISEILNINYRIAYEKAIILEKEDLLIITKAGNSKLCEFSHNFNNKVFEAEYERKRELFKNKDFLVIHNRLLFGSYARNEQSKNSDIDILVIGENEKEVQKTLSILPDKIHLTQVTYENFVHMAKSNEFSVVSEAIKNNIILVGIEEYYRLLKNAE